MTLCTFSNKKHNDLRSSSPLCDRRFIYCTSSARVLSNKKLTFNSLIAGCVAGVTGTVVGHPMDSFKVWLQTGSQGKNKHLSVSSPNSANKPRPQSTAFSSLKYIRNHIRALYSGISGPIVSVGILKSIDFAIYDGTRRFLFSLNPATSGAKIYERDYLNKDPLSHVAVGGFVSGLFLAFLTSPIYRVKQSQQISGNGFKEAAVGIIWPNGRLNMRSLYIGFVPHFAGSTFGRAVYYSTYEYSKRKFGDDVKLHKRMMCAAFAGIVCWASIFPLDSLRAHLYNQKKGKNQLGTIEMAQLMYKERAFFRGFWLTVIRAGPVAASVLPVYDLVLEQLS